MNIKKKGFTIVELVIVIAVVAILAAVLIPTFASLVKKANMSADQQAVRQMNTILAAENVENEIEGVEEVRAILLKNGFNVESYTPMAEGTRFYWVQSIKRVIYVNEEDKTVIYPLGLETGSSDLWEPLDEEINFDQSLLILMNEILDKISENGAPIDLADLYAKFANEGYHIEGYNPRDTTKAYYWLEKENKIVLVDKEDPAINANIQVEIWHMLGTIDNGVSKEDQIKLMKSIKITSVQHDALDLKNNFYSGAFYKFEINQEIDPETGKSAYDELLGVYSGWLADYNIYANTDIPGDGALVGKIEGKYYFGPREENASNLSANDEGNLLQMLLPDNEDYSAFSIKYSELVDFTFTCGAYSFDEENAGASITVQLRLYNPDNLEEFVVLTEILCIF